MPVVDQLFIQLNNSSPLASPISSSLCIVSAAMPHSNCRQPDNRSVS